MVAAGLPRGGGRWAARGRLRLAPAFHGPPALPPENDVADRRPRAPASSRGQGRGRPLRLRHLDAHAERGRNARLLRLAGQRRPPAPALPHACPAAALPLEPQLGDRPSGGGTRAVRPETCPAWMRVW